MRLFQAYILTCTLFFVAPVLEAQHILVVENIQNLKNFKYTTGDMIRLKVKSERRIVEGPIMFMEDSTLWIGESEQVTLNDIETIYRERFWIQLTRGILLTAGVAYFALDNFNRLINNDSPVVLKETAIISGGLIGMNFLLLPLRYKRIHTDKWRLTHLDFTLLDIPLYPEPGKAPE